MRISDWSSDVCSSDLLGQRAALRAEIDHPGRGLVGRPRCGDAGAQRVDHHHHAGAAAEGAVIDAAVVAFGVVARVPAQQRQQPALLRAPDDAVAGDPGAVFGDQADDVAAPGWWSREWGLGTGGRTIGRASRRDRSGSEVWITW